VSGTAGTIPVGFVIMITCSAGIHEFCHILLIPGQYSHVAKTRNLLAVLLIPIWLLSGCELIRDEPSNKALAMIETYANLTSAEFANKANELGMREQQAFNYLRALKEQGGKLRYGIDSIERKNKAHRSVVVVVTERNRFGQKKQRAQFTIELSRDKKDTWTVDSVMLIE
jgi:hypothetical protein